MTDLARTCLADRTLDSSVELARSCGLAASPPPVAAPPSLVGAATAPARSMVLG